MAAVQKKEEEKGKRQSTARLVVDVEEWYEAEQKKNPSVVVLFLSLGGESIDLTVPKGTKWGEVVNRVSASGRALYPLNASILILGNKTLDIQLYDTVETDSKVHWLIALSPMNYKHVMDLPLKAFNRGEPWPPCDNYEGDEPLSLIPLGNTEDKKGDHACASCSQDYCPTRDNTAKNMVVFAYRGAAARTGYNKFMLLRHFQQQIRQRQAPSCPTTRIPLTEDNWEATKNGGNYSVVLLG